jgi:hypothetical protein
MNEYKPAKWQVTHNNCPKSSPLSPMHTTCPAHLRLLDMGSTNHAATDPCQHLPMRTSLMSWAKLATGTTEHKQFFGSVPWGLEYKNDARIGMASFPRKVQHLWLCKIVWKNYISGMTTQGTYSLHQWRAQEFCSGEFNKFSWGQREWRSGGSSPLVRGSGGCCNLVQEISFHIVKFS